MAVTFTTTNAVVENQGIKCAIYGDAGAGKTVLAATAPRPIILAVEAGLLSLKRSNIERLFGVNVPGISYESPVMQIATAEDLNDAYAWCSHPANGQYFDTIYLDSVTEIAEVILSKAKATVKDPRQAYGELIDKMEILVKGFINIRGKHVVMTAKMEPLKDEMTGIVKNHPMMPGSKLGPKFPYMFDEVFRMGVNKDPQGNSYRFLQTQPDLQYVAKDRSGALAALEPANLTHVFNKILGA